MNSRTLASLTSFQSSFYSLILRDESAYAELVDALASNIAKDPDPWHMIDLNLMDPSDPKFEDTRKAFEKHGFRCEPYVFKGNWHEIWNFDSFSSYLNQRSKSARKSIKNYQRKLRKLEKAGTIGIEIYRGSENLDSIVRQCHEIYEKSWKKADFFPEFYEGLMRECARYGRLRMVIVSIDDKPAAFEFAIVSGSQCVMMRTAYDPAFRRDSVGSIAILKMIEHVIEKDCVREVDFGTDDNPYKSVWVKHRRELHGLVFFNKATVLGNTYWAIYRLNRALNGMARKAKQIIVDIARLK